MSNVEEKLEKYVNMLSDPNSVEFLNAKRELLELSKEDNKLAILLVSIEGESLQNIQNMINVYIKSKEIEQSKDEKETISKIFGIDISEIEHRQLNNGKEVFAFYDSEYSRKRVLENPENGKSLTEQLKKIQNENQDFQGIDDYKENANSMLKRQATDFNCELNMIYIGDISEYQKIIDGLEDKKRMAFDNLLKQKDINDIEYINIENCIALDSEGHMLESFIDENTNEPRLEKPKEYNYTVSEIDNKDEVYGNTVVDTYNKETETFEISYNDLEDMPELIEAELADVYKVGVSREQLHTIGNNIIKYYNNPDAMNNLSPEERAFYEKFVSMLATKIELKKEKSNAPVLEYNSNGFINIILISVIAIIIGFIITLIF